MVVVPDMLDFYKVFRRANKRRTPGALRPRGTSSRARARPAAATCSAGAAPAARSARTPSARRTLWAPARACPGVTPARPPPPPPCAPPCFESEGQGRIYMHLRSILERHMAREPWCDTSAPAAAAAVRAALLRQRGSTRLLYATSHYAAKASPIQQPIDAPRVTSCRPYARSTVTASFAGRWSDMKNRPTVKMSDYAATRASGAY